MNRFSQLVGMKQWAIRPISSRPLLLLAGCLAGVENMDVELPEEVIGQVEAFEVTSFARRGAH